MYCAVGASSVLLNRMKPLDRMTAITKFNVGEAFGVPHTFNPNLSLLQALFAVAVAFSRIFLGSLLFALWGVAAWMAYAAVGNPALRIIVVIPIVLLFLLTLLTLMLGISSLAEWLTSRRSGS